MLDILRLKTELEEIYEIEDLKIVVNALPIFFDKNINQAFIETS